MLCMSGAHFSTFPRASMQPRLLGFPHPMRSGAALDLVGSPEEDHLTNSIIRLVARGKHPLIALQTAENNALKFGSFTGTQSSSPCANKVRASSARALHTCVSTVPSCPHSFATAFFFNRSAASCMSTLKWRETLYAAAVASHLWRAHMLAQEKLRFASGHKGI